MWQFKNKLYAHESTCNLFKINIFGNLKFRTITMKNKLLVISALLLMIIATLLSCADAKKSAQKAVPPIDPANLDKTVLPGNDFDTYANGGWKKLNPLPSDRGRFGSFDKLAEVAEKQLNDLVKTTAASTNAKGSVADKIASLFNSGMDTVKIEKQG